MHLGRAQAPAQALSDRLMRRPHSVAGHPMKAGMRFRRGAPAYLLAILGLGTAVPPQAHAAQALGQDQTPAIATVPPTGTAKQSLLPEPAAPQAAEPARSTRPGRSGRDLGSRSPTPQPESAGGVQPALQAKPSPPAVVKQPQEAVAQPSPPPPVEPRQAGEDLPQSEAFRLEQEQRRKQMEQKQYEAEEAERERRETRLREIMQQQQEAVRKEEALRRQLLEQLPLPAK